MYKRKLLIAAASCALAAALGIGGITAYLTDAEAAVNTITVGQVQIDLTEPEYDDLTEEEKGAMEPRQKIVKDPYITNTGTNKAVVFLKVSVPVESVITAADDGTKENNGEAAEQELFKLLNSSDGDASETPNTGWVLLSKTSSAEELAYKRSGSTEEHIGQFYTYVFGYEDVLDPDEKTATPLFSKVQLINIIEGQIDNTSEDILVTAYAIQEGSLADITVSDTGNSKDTLTSVWTILSNQKDGETIPDADTNNKLDVGGETL